MIPNSFEYQGTKLYDNPGPYSPATHPYHEPIVKLKEEVDAEKLVADFAEYAREKQFPSSEIFGVVLDMALTKLSAEQYKDIFENIRKNRKTALEKDNILLPPQLEAAYSDQPERLALVYWLGAMDEEFIRGIVQNSLEQLPEEFRRRMIAQGKYGDGHPLMIMYRMVNGVGNDEYMVHNVGLSVGIQYSGKVQIMEVPGFDYTLEHGGGDQCSKHISLHSMLDEVCSHGLSMSPKGAFNIAVYDQKGRRTRSIAVGAYGGPRWFNHLVANMWLRKEMNMENRIPYTVRHSLAALPRGESNLALDQQSVQLVERVASPEIFAFWHDESKRLMTALKAMIETTQDRRSGSLRHMQDFIEYLKADNPSEKSGATYYPRLRRKAPQAWIEMLKEKDMEEILPLLMYAYPGKDIEYRRTISVIAEKMEDIINTHDKYALMATDPFVGKKEVALGGIWKDLVDEMLDAETFTDISMPRISFLPKQNIDPRTMQVIYVKYALDQIIDENLRLMHNEDTSIDDKLASRLLVNIASRLQELIWRRLVQTTLQSGDPANVVS